MSTLPTGCALYGPLINGSQTAIVSEYTPNTLLGGPPFLQVTVVKTDTALLNRSIYDVTIGTPSNETAVIKYTVDITDNSSTLTSLSSSVLFSDFSGLGQDQLALINTIVLIGNINGSPLPPGTFVNGDSYQISLSTDCPNEPESSLGIMVIVTRPPPPRNFGGTIGNSVIPISPTSVPCTDCSCLIKNDCKKINVPIVSILGQVTIDYSDVGDVIFTICDKYEYYDCERVACTENKCTVGDYIDPENLKQTKFHQCCPFMVSVLKGEGETLREKSDFLWRLNKEELRISQDEFYKNITR